MLNSDAHVSVNVGDLALAQALVREAGVPQELIINRSPEAFKAYLFQKGKAADLKNP